MRVVLDTNILISALMVKSGNPAAIYRAWQEGHFTLLTCGDQLEELRATLHKRKVAERIKPYEPAAWSTRSRSSPRPSVGCRALNARPIQRTTFCSPCPKRARLII